VNDDVSDARGGASIDLKVVTDLAFLIRCDTRNPPRAPAGFVQVFDFVAGQLQGAGFTSTRRDLGDGCLWLLATRGAGGPLVNIHMDTVPAAPGWERDPLELHGANNVFTGLGVCDTKGALACFLHAARTSQGPVQLLLTTDEEAGQSRCVRTFCEEVGVKDRLVVVAEPTRMEAVLAHRGIGTCAGVFSGTPGHGSQARAMKDSANHEAVKWASRVLGFVEHTDVRFNLGLLEGGTKPNMIAGECRVRFGVRPPPGMRTSDVVDALCSLVDDDRRVTWTSGYLAPPLTENARADAERLPVTVGAPVDFFTEAALFQEAGARAFVVGPGDIADAHTAHEKVTAEDLVKAVHFYRALLGAASTAHASTGGAA
jgi:acetylornithine deacetylase